MEKIDLKNMTLAELTAWVEGLNLKPFRARQIFSWIHRPDFHDFMAMTDIAKHVRMLLAQRAYLSRLEPCKVERSADGTRKFAFLLADGKIVESVLIPEDDRNTLCISSQVGCAMGCSFCLTGTMGFIRNLTAAEIVGQVDAVIRSLKMEDGSRHQESTPPETTETDLAPPPVTGEQDAEHDNEPAADSKRPIHNLVFMGMGEPLLNFDNLIRAIEILMEQRGHDFSGRRITVSTCGIVPKMKELGEKVPVNLAVSLHAADDQTRDLLMPINKKYPLPELLQACRDYPLAPRRRIMIEYVMIEGLNDSPAAARLLVKKLHGIRCKVNILPYNETPNSPYRRPSDTVIEDFRQILRKAGHTTLLRTSRGADISAACGQLATD